MKNRNWPMRKLREICEMRMGETLIKKDLTGDGIPVYSADTFEEPWGFTSKNKLKFTKGAIIVGARGTLGSVKLPKEAQFTSTQTTIIITPQQEIISSPFLFYYLQTVDFKELRGGSGIPMLTVNRLRVLEIPLPPLPEQQKIVYVLDSIREAIEAQEKIIEKTKELKKSLLDEIFNSKVKSQNSKLKFKIQKLSHIAKVKYGKAKPKEENGDIPVVGSGGIYGFTNKALIQQPTIIIGRKGTAGMTHLILKPCWPSDTTFYLEINLEEVNPRYLYEFMKTKIISGEEAKTTLPSLKREALETLEIKLLPLPEQQKIAEILQTIDQKIEIEQKKKALYEELFKTMLNKLMTGEIRVNNIKF